MLTLETRPQTFRELVGQDIVKKALLHIIKDPVNSPKTLLLQGGFGSGKTTTARIFARALNCPNKLPNGDACGQKDCPICGHDIQDSMFYDEYDSAIVGNVNSIKELRNTFYFGYTEGFKVIVLDEVHLVNRTAQSALLKVFEEPEPNVFFLLCTTDPEKLLPTIISRSFELRFNTIEEPAIIEHLKKVCSLNNVEVTPEIDNNLKLIARRSHGHMRNAIMMLDSMFLLKEDFISTAQDSESLFVRLITFSLQFQSVVQKTGSVESAQQLINDIISQLTVFPLANLKQDYERLVLKIARHTFYSKEDQSILVLVQGFENSFNLINTINDPYIYMMFSNTSQFQACMLLLSNRLRTLKR